MSTHSQSRNVPGVAFLCGTQTQGSGCHPEIPVSLSGIPEPPSTARTCTPQIPLVKAFSSPFYRATQQILSGIQPKTLEVFSNPNNSTKSRPGHFSTHTNRANPPLWAGSWISRRGSLPPALLLAGIIYRTMSQDVPPGRTGLLCPGLTSLPALAGDQDHDDEEDEEEQQSGQDVAQLLEKVQPALRDDDIDDIVAPDHGWI